MGKVFAVIAALVLGVAMAAALIACMGAPADAAPGVELSMLTQGKKVIPIVLEYPGLTVTDIKLPDLILTNGSSEPISPLGIEVIGTLKGEEVARFQVRPDTVKALINGVHPQLKGFGAGEEGRHLLSAAFGRTNLDTGKLSDGLPIKSGEQGVILLSKVLYFHYVGLTTVDALKVTLSYESTANRESVELPIPLTEWKSQVKYRFPLKGSIIVLNMPLDYLSYHRQSYSQEFGFDMMEIHPEKSGLDSASKPGSSKLTDYYIYGRDVLAAADGTVVEVADAFPESKTVSPGTWTLEAQAGVIKRLSGKIPYSNILLGNYVVIQHGPEEFSFFAHLKQHSFKAKVGQKVKAGQPIARVSCTGVHCTEPGLHFQLMDSGDFFTANSLPIMFEDIPASRMVQHLTKANTLACSDNLLVVGVE